MSEKRVREEGVEEEGEVKCEPEEKKARSIPGPVQIRNKYVFYPDQYDTFDPTKILFSKDPQQSKDGSGEILFMSYAFEDGSRPLMIRTPSAMHSPTGITTWKNGGTTLLLSAGRGWDGVPTMVKFKQVVDSIQKRCIETVCEKNWNKGGSSSPEIVQELYTDVMGEAEDKQTGAQYPPSIKVNFILDGTARSELFEKIEKGDGSYLTHGIVPNDVGKGFSMTAILHFPWVFRRKAKKGWSFSTRCNLFQARVFPPTCGGQSEGASYSVCD